VRALISRLVELMFELGALQIRPSDPVTWTSGARMPVYNDNRRLISHPHARALVTDGMKEIVYSQAVQPEGVVGTATSGIAPAASLADILKIRLYYVRPRTKSHGLARRVEGFCEGDLGCRVVLVEDLVSTGGSSATAAEAIHSTGFSLLYGIAIFSYGFAEADQTFEAMPFPFTMQTLITLDDVLAFGSKMGYLKMHEIELLRGWQADPFGWSKNRTALGEHGTR